MMDVIFRFTNKVQHWISFLREHLQITNIRENDVSRINKKPFYFSQFSDPEFEALLTNFQTLQLKCQRKKTTRDISRR